MTSVTGDPLWSVEIEIGHDERVSMDYAGTRVTGPDSYMVVRPWEDGPSTVHIDVAAPTAEDAFGQAVTLYQRMRETAELPPDERPRVLTVSRVVGLPHAWDRYIFAAGEMLEQQQYGLAVVAAQVHCEMYIRHAMETVAAQAATPIAVLAPSLVRSWSLTDRAGPEIFEALLGVKPASAECWGEYRTHVYRRNAVVHQGAQVTADLARSSMDAAIAMVKFAEEALVAALLELESRSEDA